MASNTLSRICNFVSPEHDIDNSTTRDTMGYLSGCLEDQTFSPECEIFTEKADFETIGTHCTKNPGHDKFIPVKAFSQDCLPRELKSAENATKIREMIDRTVRVEVRYTSPDRPNTYSDKTTPYPYTEFKGRGDVVRYGTGFIHKMPDFEPLADTSCPCHECRSPYALPQNKYYIFLVHTASHVIFDDAEAERATFDCFYDSEEEEEEEGGGGVTIYRLYGVQLSEAFASSNNGYQSDFCEVVCAVHDEETVKKISEMLSLSNFPNSVPRRGFVPSQGVIVSHPHGRSKKISFGKTLFVTVPIKPNYRTGVPSHLPYGTKCRIHSSNGKAREKKKKLGKEEFKHKQRVDNDHNDDNDNSNDGDDNGNDDFGRTAKSEHYTVSKSDKVDDRILRKKTKMSKAKKTHFAVDVNDDVYKTQYNIDRDFNKKKKHELETIASVGYDESASGFKPEGSYKTNTKHSQTQSDELLISKMGRELRALSDRLDFHQLPDLLDLHSPPAEKIEQLKTFFLDMAENFLSKPSNGDSSKNTFKTSEIEKDLDMFQERHGECSADRRALWVEGPINIFSKAVGHLSNFGENVKSLLTTDFLTGVSDMFHENLKTHDTIPPPIGVDESEVTFDLPYGTTFTLPFNAKYAMRYQSRRPGWFQFPPKTKFETKEGDLIQIPDGSEFQNPFFFPQHYYAVHNMPTCPGSSGAIIYADLMSRGSELSRFVHDGSTNDGRTCLSSVQENRLLLPQMDVAIPALISSWKSALNSQEGSPSRKSPMEKQCLDIGLD